MSNTVYKNHDTSVIKELLKEIGKHRYEQALENLNVTQKPLGMKGWYIEATQDYLRLCYKYPSRIVLELMDVEGYDNIPKQGWKKIKEEQ